MKNKLYSSINVFGLALGMACSLLIGLWVKDELSYDHFLIDAENIYYVRVNFSYNGETGAFIGRPSKDFLKLVLIALLLSTPLAWWALSKWLETFAYREDLTWWIFEIAGVLAVVIAFLTVSYQSIKAALMNPVTSLRSE